MCVCVHWWAGGCAQRDEAAELRGQLASSQALVRELRVGDGALTLSPPRAAATAAPEPPAATTPENHPVVSQRAPRPSMATATPSPRRVPASTHDMGLPSSTKANGKFANGGASGRRGFGTHTPKSSRSHESASNRFNLQQLYTLSNGPR